MYQGDSVDGNDGKNFQTNKKVIVSKKVNHDFKKPGRKDNCSGLFRPNLYGVTYMMARGIQNRET